MEIVGEIDLPSGTLAVLDPGLARQSLRERGGIDERIRRALERGLGTLELRACATVVAGGFPRDRPLQVFAVPLPGGEFDGRLRSIDVPVDPARPVARSQRVEGVAVEHGAVLLLDASLLGELQVEPADGLADLVLWGPDAAQLAHDLGASELDAHHFGWRDLPLAEVGAHARPLYDAIESRSLRVSTDYRPHDDVEEIWSQIRSSSSRSASVTIAGCRAVALDTRWGDGLVPVIRDLDERGEVVSMRIDVGNEETQDLMRRLVLRHRGALVSRRVLAGAQPARYADRYAATRDTDSGWVISSGAEAGMTPEEFAVMRVDELLRRIAALADVIDTPAPARFTLRGKTYRREP